MWSFDLVERATFEFRLSMITVFRERCTGIRCNVLHLTAFYLAGRMPILCNPVLMCHNILINNRLYFFIKKQAS